MNLIYVFSDKLTCSYIRFLGRVTHDTHVLRKILENLEKSWFRVDALGLGLGLELGLGYKHGLNLCI